MKTRWILILAGMVAFGLPSFAQIPDGTPVDAIVQTDTAAPPTFQRMTFSADYLLGWIESTDSIPLATTSLPGTPRANAGVLGLPSTGVLNNGTFPDGPQSGFRLDGSWRFDPSSLFSLQGGFWMLGKRRDTFAASSATSPILARPYLNAATFASESVLVAFPGNSTGAMDIQGETKSLFGGHFSLTERLFESRRVKADCIFGYRFYRFDDSIRAQQTVFPTSANFAPGTRLFAVDNFGAQNEFHGVDSGIRAEISAGNLTIGLLAKIAVGRVEREVSIAGGQVVSVPGQADVTRSGGVLALDSNIGTFRSVEWGVLPEFGVTLKYRISEVIAVHCGYSILILGEVARAAEQIDQVLDPSLFPPAGAAQTSPARPTFILNHSDVVVQFLRLGIGFRY